MAITQWTPVSWIPNEDITDTKLNTMVANDEFLRTKTVNARYSAYGVNTDQNVKIIGGISYVSANTGGPSRTLLINFPTVFSTGCKPAITTGIYSAGSRYLMATVQARAGASPIPDAQGFRVTVSYFIPKGPLKLNACYIAWQAIGY